MQQVARYEGENNLPICWVSVVSLVFVISREFFSVHRLSYLAPYASRMVFIARLWLAIIKKGLTLLGISP